VSVEGEPSEPGPDRAIRRTRVSQWLGFLLLLVVVGGVGYAVGRIIGSAGDSGSSHAALPSPTTNPRRRGPTDPSASALSKIVVRQADVGSSLAVGLIPHGNEVSGQATLDLCNATFATEKLRRARLQVVAASQPGAVALSTEAVLYVNPADAARAMTELQHVAASCPRTPVASPVGEATVATKFNARPDGAWAAVPGVDRQAFDFVTTDSAGTSQHLVSVYLQRGRALLGLYFPAPDGPLPAVAGKTTIEGVTQVFANRLARLPTSVTGG
jgi:hypothetical protein